MARIESSSAEVLQTKTGTHAIKTASATIRVLSGAGNVSFAHKIPFNYAWDIVVVNGPATFVAP